MSCTPLERLARMVYLSEVGKQRTHTVKDLEKIWVFYILYTTEREDKIIDSESCESCVNVREWCACVNMGDRLLSVFVWMRAVCVFEQSQICNKRLLLTQDRF